MTGTRGTEYLDKNEESRETDSEDADTRRCTRRRKKMTPKEEKTQRKE
jgi:hypothetical protein